MTIALLFFVALSIALGIALIKLHNKQIKIETLNLEVKSKNALAEQTHENLNQMIESKRQELDELKSNVKSQNELVQSLTNTADDLRKNAEERAEEVYQARLASYETRVSALELQYKKKDAEFQSQLQQVSEKIVQEERKLSDLEAKQAAYVEAQRRRQEMETQKDFYRLEINDYDKNDIILLREMQSRFVRKEAIDKLIWEVYFKKPYDALMSRLALDATKKCGIYKITNLTTGEPYIGQSVDIKERFRAHIKSGLFSAPATNKFYQAMKKYGPEDFTFEILEEVSRDKLNEREIYWIDFYKTREFGLNGTKGGS